jgi:HlyD family secretion protein
MKMKNGLLNIAFILAAAFLFGCSNGNGDFDATGTFESEEIIVSSEATGKLIFFNVDEGFEIKQNQTVGIVHTTQLHLKKKQLL